MAPPLRPDPEWVREQAAKFKAMYGPPATATTPAGMPADAAPTVITGVDMATKIDYTVISMSIRSSSQPGRLYNVVLYGDGRAECDCAYMRFADSHPGKHCRHISEALTRWANAQLRSGKPQSTQPPA